MVTPAARREAVVWIRDERGASERRACELASCARSVARYTSRRYPQEELRAKLREVAARKPRYGYRRLAWQLRREGLAVNDKRIYRLYRSEGLQVRKAKRKRFAAQHRPTERPWPRRGSVAKGAERGSWKQASTRAAVRTASGEADPLCS